LHKPVWFFHRINTENPAVHTIITGLLTVFVVCLKQLALSAEIGLGVVIGVTVEMINL
jgi:hypothetical protein